ncbi:MAG: GNAT family N-acetyltransferase [Meiothermus sp.]|nr:GNAT family N-acetyltransferase [Meiothermus sp.]
MDDLTIANNPEKRRYEVSLGGETVAHAEYRAITGAVMFTHTEVDEQLEGRGVGTKLIRFALEDTKAQSLLVIPMCPFVVAFIQRHRDEFGCGSSPAAADFRLIAVGPEP